MFNNAYIRKQLKIIIIIFNLERKKKRKRLEFRN